VGKVVVCLGTDILCHIVARPPSVSVPRKPSQVRLIVREIATGKLRRAILSRINRTTETVYLPMNSRYVRRSAYAARTAVCNVIRKCAIYKLRRAVGVAIDRAAVSAVSPVLQVTTGRRPNPTSEPVSNSPIPRAAATSSGGSVSAVAAHRLIANKRAMLKQRITVRPD
jgi:hypothetical protein